MPFLKLCKDLQAVIDQTCEIVYLGEGDDISLGERSIFGQPEEQYRASAVKIQIVMTGPG